MSPKKLLQKTNNFFKQLPAKFKALTLEEKIAYGLILFGIILIILALFLF